VGRATGSLLQCCLAFVEEQLVGFKMYTLTILHSISICVIDSHKEVYGIMG
jgi:hypothetical protein